MFDKSDPRAHLFAKAGPAGTEMADAEVAEFHQHAPQTDDAAGKTWVTRGQNFILTYTEALPGAVLERAGQPDEYVALLPDAATGCTVWANGEQQQVAGHSLIILPPGTSRITLPDGGRVTRIFSPLNPDLAAMAANGGSFTTPWPNIPPYQPWPAPRDGYRIRAYSLDIAPQPGRFGRIFRCSTLMINVLEEQIGPRDIHKLSPHHHDDFEQGSLALAGSFTHHLRWPWVPDMDTWRDDQHARVGSPSLTVIPPPVIHTSRGMDAGLNQLIDIFSPPRYDFSRQPGWVLNGDDYPMPDAGTA